MKETQMTYQDNFVRIEPKGWFSRQPEADYHQIIDKHAKLGWRLVTIVTPPPGNLMEWWDTTS